ncbi:Asp-tRNAAsn/Glu-tRNAGln amidotransferase A subunit [Modestobacter sp. DSM 44400]|uniref:amidase n=1 Tax=Modestobacter sp. DSM 44400 TaxID=1550230 RepID=UPI000899698F|nr:amidase family protein [Modestobacter sp. DSM 44400]SDY28021.1 Asp-tRNAAsn/Glu-tRNAGln amidotransferase A subunit [Modestobacter sp. DSM 44400]
MSSIGRGRAVAAAVEASALIVGTNVAGPAAAHAPDFPVEQASVASIRDAIAGGRTTCREVVAASLHRIQAYDDRGPSLQAVLRVNNKALSTAAALDRQYRKHGFAGPLHCVPVLLKDNYDTEDLPTTAGSAALAGAQPPDDAETVARLRDAGAVVIGKSNLHEFAVAGFTASSLGGQTLNPYDPTRTPGGSSGGTGAGVAAGFAVVGTGTDTVNSIRSPASANNLVGLRPTRGLVSRDGIVPVSSTQDAAGPIGRSVADVAAVLQVMAGADPKDSATDVLAGRTLPDYLAALDGEGLGGARIGVVTDFLLEGEQYEPVNTVVEQARADLVAEGATLVDVSLDATASALSTSYDVQRFEYEPLLESNLATTDAPVDTLEEIRASGLPDPSVQPFLTAADETGDGRTSAEYAQRLVGIADLRARLLALMDAQGLDLLFYPMQSRLVEPVAEQAQRDRNGILAALTGFPALTVPGGFSEPTADAPLGVPVGVEFLARPFDEPRLLAAGQDYEEATGHRTLPASTPPL